MDGLDFKLMGRMVADVMDDFSRPQVGWQFVALAACLVLAWLLARRIRTAAQARAKARAARLPEGESLTQIYALSSLYRAAFPLLGWLFVAMVRAALMDLTHTNILRIALVPLLSMSLLYLSFFLIRRVFRVSSTAIGSIRLAEQLLSAVAWIGMALYILGVLPQLLGWLDSMHFQFGRSKLSVLEIASAGFWILLTVVGALWVSSLIDERLDSAEGINTNFKIVLSRVFRALLILAALLFSLSLVGIDLTVLSVFGGALGVGLGFGMQKIASNYVSGFLLLLENSLRIGDLLQVDKYQGAVAQIRTRYTLLKGADGVEALIPNETLISGVVQNLSFTEPKIRLAVQIQASYRDDPDTVLATMAAAARGVSRVLEDPPPTGFLLGFADSGINYELGFWIQDPGNGRLGVMSDVNLAIWRAFKQKGIEILYPQREIRILGESGGAGNLSGQ
ncbi:MAG: mechanosensitive ion channel [Candidatus Protistobacter heckmanni]|nr:mechanosensitive ion channel [Candidatus Protistobacter heckmanni]